MMVAAIYNYKRASVIRCALRDGRGVYRAGRVWRVVIEMGPGVFVLANKQRAGRAGYWHARYLAKKAAHKRKEHRMNNAKNLSFRAYPVATHTQMMEPTRC